MLLAGFGVGLVQREGTDAFLAGEQDGGLRLGNLRPFRCRREWFRRRPLPSRHPPPCAGRIRVGADRGSASGRRLHRRESRAPHSVRRYPQDRQVLRHWLLRPSRASLTCGRDSGPIWPLLWRIGRRNAARVPPAARRPEAWAASSHARVLALILRSFTRHGSSLSPYSCHTRHQMGKRDGANTAKSTRPPPRGCAHDARYTRVSPFLT